MVQHVDARLREATIAVLHERGWDGLTLERVAEVAGRARSTLWRQGLTCETLIGALVGELAEDFRDSLYPVLTADGSGPARLGAGRRGGGGGRGGGGRGPEAFGGVGAPPLPLMLATDEAFHQEPAPGQP